MERRMLLQDTLTIPLARLLVKPLENISCGTFIKEYSLGEVGTLAGMLYGMVSDEEFDVVVGVEKKGIPLAKYLSKRLDAHFDSIRINQYSGSVFYPIPVLTGMDFQPCIMKKPENDYEDRRILLVDDWCNTGRTLDLASRCLKGETKTAVLFNSPESEYRTDFSLNSGLFPKNPVFPWTKLALKYVDPMRYEIPLEAR